MQQLVTAQASRNRDLEARLQRIHAAEGAPTASSSISSPDSACDIAGHNFQLFGEDVLNGINGMAMVDILHTLAPEDSEAYLGMPFTSTAESKSPTNHLQSLETLHENDPTFTSQLADADGDLEMDDSSPSVSASSPDAPRVEPDVNGDSDLAERGRSRRRSKIDGQQPVEIKKETESPPPS